MTLFGNTLRSAARIETLRLAARVIAVTLLLLVQTACLATAVNGAVDTTIAVAKVPFKVAGAAVDVVIPDGDDSDKED